MKAAVITAAGQPPIYGDFREPVASQGMELITVAASALSQFSKARSSGTHYSSEGMFPSVAGVDGVGRTATGQRVYFVLPEAPFGSLAEKSLVRSGKCVAVPDGLDDVTAAAIANPGMSAWAALVERSHQKDRLAHSGVPQRHGFVKLDDGQAGDRRKRLEELSGVDHAEAVAVVLDNGEDRSGSDAA